MPTKSDCLTPDEVDRLLADVHTSDDGWLTAESDCLTPDEVEHLLAGICASDDERLTVDQINKITSDEIAAASVDIENARIRRSCWREFERLVAKLERSKS